MAEATKTPNERNERVVMVGLSFIITVLAAWLGTGNVAFAELTLPAVTAITTNLLFVALLIERALEVFITSYTATGRAENEANVKRCTENVADAEKSEKPGDAVDAKAVLHDAETDAKRFKARTQVIALQSSVILGLLTAAVGYRVLAQLVNTSELTGLGVQGFVFIDVLLTGGLLAGGSKGIHALTQVFGKYLDDMAARPGS